MTERADNPDAPVSDEERASAEALRLSLADPSRNNAEADFARSIALAHAPPALSPQAHRAILERSMVRGELQRKEREGKGQAQRRRFLQRSVPVVALAAAVALFVLGKSLSSPPDAVLPPMTPARSTQALFNAPFARMGGESARLDRIAAARTSDLRDNRFASWGVR